MTLAKKGSKKRRLIHDFRDLNALMRAFGWVFMLVAYILDFLSGYVIFSTVDMTSGFWQCPLAQESRKYTAFSSPSGHWQYCVCPQGIKIGPGWFSFCVNFALSKSFALNTLTILLSLILTYANSKSNRGANQE